MKSNSFPKGHELPDFTRELVGLHVFPLQILRPLGTGTFGAVYYAQRLGSDEEYAVKIMPKPADGCWRHMYQDREFENQAKLCGLPNVVQMLERFYDDDYCYFVMKFYPGGDLRQATKSGLLVKNDALIKHFYLQILDGVEECHKNGVYHRDLKPSNIFLDEMKTTPFIGDFGLSTVSEWSTNFRAGTGTYSSPECLDPNTPQGSYNARTNDIWALGMTLVYLITGRYPWNTASSDDAHYVAFTTNPNFWKERLPISTEIAEVLNRIFTPRGEERISISELRDMVKNVDVFTMPDDEIAASNEVVQKAARRHFRRASAGEKSKAVEEAVEYSEPIDAHLESPDVSPQAVVALVAGHDEQPNAWDMAMFQYPDVPQQAIEPNTSIDSSNTHEFDSQCSTCQSELEAKKAEEEGMVNEEDPERRIAVEEIRRMLNANKRVLDWVDAIQDQDPDDCGGLEEVLSYNSYDDMEYRIAECGLESWLWVPFFRGWFHIRGVLGGVIVV